MASDVADFPDPDSPNKPRVPIQGWKAPSRTAATRYLCGKADIQVLDLSGRTLPFYLNRSTLPYKFYVTQEAE